jgi:hypothetical protein
VVHTVERGILVEDVLVSIFKSFVAIIPRQTEGSTGTDAPNDLHTAGWSCRRVSEAHITKTRPYVVPLGINIAFSRLIPIFLKILLRAEIVLTDTQLDGLSE